MATNLSPEVLKALRDYYANQAYSGWVFPDQVDPSFSYQPQYAKYTDSGMDSATPGQTLGVGPITGYERIKKLDKYKFYIEQYDPEGQFLGSHEWEEDNTAKALAKGIAFVAASYFGINALADAGLAGAAGAGAEGAAGLSAADAAFLEANMGALAPTASEGFAGMSGLGGMTDAAGWYTGPEHLQNALYAGGDAAVGDAAAVGGWDAATNAAMDAAAIGSATSIPPSMMSGGGFGDWLSAVPGRIGNALSNSTPSDWLRFGAPLLNAGISAYGINKATDAQIGASQESNALLKSIYDQNVARNEPFVTGGVKGFYDLLDKLGISGNTGAAGYGSMNRTTSPEDVLKTPGYQFGLDQGLKAQGQKLNAQGMSYSGPAIKAATRYGTDYATTKFNDAFNRDETSKGNEYNRLMGVTQIGQGAANFQGAQGMNYAQQAGQNLQGAGNAAAANALGTANAVTGAINQGVSAYQNQGLNDAYIAYLRSIGMAPKGP